LTLLEVIYRQLKEWGVPVKQDQLGVYVRIPCFGTWNGIPPPDYCFTITRDRREYGFWVRENEELFGCDPNDPHELSDLLDRIRDIWKNAIKSLVCDHNKKVVTYSTAGDSYVIYEQNGYAVIKPGPAASTTIVTIGPNADSGNLMEIYNEQCVAGQYSKETSARTAVSFKYNLWIGLLKLLSISG
jgi:hypothetical protein